MKKLVLALGLTALGATATAAAAQDVVIRTHRGGHGWHRGFDGDRAERVIIRRGHRHDVRTTGSVDCRTTIIKKRNAMGDVVRKTIRRCD